MAVLVVSVALPLREYLSQRAEIGTLQASQGEASQRVAALEQERGRLQDPAYIAAEARRRLHFVLPGETAYVLVQPPTAQESGPVGEAPPGTGGSAGPAPDGADAPPAPWYLQMWGTVREADRPTAK